jgi:hypothetical protein
LKTWPCYKKDTKTLVTPGEIFPRRNLYVEKWQQSALAYEQRKTCFIPASQAIGNTMRLRPAPSKNDQEKE